jgi:hypothetical protein
MDMVIPSGLEIDHVHAHTIPADDPAMRYVFNNPTRYGRLLNDQGIRIASDGQYIILSATLPNRDRGLEWRKHTLLNICVREPGIGDYDL